LLKSKSASFFVTVANTDFLSTGLADFVHVFVLTDVIAGLFDCFDVLGLRYGAEV